MKKYEFLQMQKLIFFHSVKFTFGKLSCVQFNIERSEVTA